MRLRWLGYFAVLVLLPLLGAGAALYFTGNLRWPLGEKSDDDAVAGALRQMQKACASDPALRGTMIKTVEIVDGRLVLRGVLERPEQRAPVEKQAAEIFGSLAEAKDKFPAGISADQLKVLPLRQQVPVLQRRFSTAKIDDPERLKLLRHTRLDDAFFGEDGKAYFVGVCVHGSAAVAASESALRTEIHDFLASKDVPEADLPAVELRVRFFDNPVNQLQEVAHADPGLAGAEFVNAWYDADGKLQLDGYLPREALLETVRQRVRKLVDNHAAGPELVQGGKDVKKDALPGMHFEVFNPEAEAKKLQLRLVEEGTRQRETTGKAPLLQVRLLRAILRPDEKNPGSGDRVLRFEGSYFYIGEEQSPLLVKQLEVWLEKEVQQRFAGEKKSTRIDLQKVAALPSPVLALQKRAFKAGLDGTLFDSVRYDAEGNIHIDGLLGNSAQKKAVVALVTEVLARDSGWSIEGMEPICAAEDAKEVPWSEVIVQLRKQLAGDPDPLFRQTRLDRAYFEYDGDMARLFCEGVHLYAADKAAPDLVAMLDGKLRAGFKALIQRPKEPPVRAERIAAVESPVFALQKVAIAEGLDGVLFEKAWYDSAGKLLFAGFVGGKEQAGRVAEMVPAILKGSRVLGPDGLGPLTQMKMLAWPAMLKDVQAGFAGDPDWLFRQTRVDRAYFAHEGAGPARVHFSGVCIYTAKDLSDAQRIGKFQNKLRVSLSRAAVIHEPAATDIVVIDNPVFKLQQLADRDKLDGVLFDQSWYDAAGKLQFKAFLGTKEQAKPVEEILRKTLQGSPAFQAQPAPAPMPKEARADDAATFFIGLGQEQVPDPFAQLVSGFEVWDWPARLRDVQARLAASADLLFQETRLDRAWFTRPPDRPLAVLNFKGVSLHAGDEPAVVLRGRLEKLFQGLIRGPEYTPDAAALEFRDSPVYRLQQDAVAQKLDGVLFEQARYDARGRLRVRVLVPTEVKQEVVDKIADANPTEAPVLDAASVGEPPHSLLVPRSLSWREMLQTVQQQLASSPEALLYRTRVDRAWFDYAGTRQPPRLHWEGVSLQPGKAGADDPRPALLKDNLAGLVPGVRYEPLVAGFAFHKNPIYTLQAAAAAQKLGGVLFEDGRYDAAGKLRLDTLLPAAKVRDAVEMLVRKTTLPEQVMGGGDPVLKTRIFDWSAMLRGVQANLARSEDPLPRQTRVDSAWLSYTKDEQTVLLTFEGVCLYPKADSDGDPRSRLEKYLVPAVPRVAYKTVTDAIALRVSPIFALQPEAARRGLDGLLFEEAAYDAAGTLRLHMLIPAGIKQDAVAELVEKNPAVEAVLTSGPNAPATAWTIVSHGIDWAARLKDFQVGLAKGPEAQHRKTRVDRAWFTYPAERSWPELHVEAVGLYAAEKETDTRFRDRIDQLGRTAWAVSLRARKADVVPHLAAVPNPAPVLQAKVAGNEAMDGVRIDDTFFDAEGRLVLDGIWRSDRQREGLASLAVQVARDAAGDPLRRGLAWERMREVPTQQLLRRLREWCADTTDLEEVYLERLYFDAAGQVKVQGFYTHPEDRDRVQKSVLDLIKAFPVQGILKPASEAPAQKAALPRTIQLVSLQQPPQGLALLLQAPADVTDLTQLPSLATYLRAKVPLETIFDGIRIDRVYYDPGGSVVIDSLEDSADQVDLLGLVLDPEEVRAKWPRQLRSGWRPGRQTVIPLRPMLRCLARVLLDHEEFDGISLDRAFHDSANRLAFGGVIVGQRDRARAAQMLKELLDTHPRWRVRTTAGVSLEPLRAVPASPQPASAAVQKALALLKADFPDTGVIFCSSRPLEAGTSVLTAGDKIDAAAGLAAAARLHAPGDSTAWYLYAYTALARNDRDVARRALRRVALLEEENFTLREKRLLNLELVQGALRQQVEQLAASAAVAAARGSAPLSLADCP